MGKNKVIKSLGRVIGNVAVHKFLLEHTNYPESKNHLSHEIVEYNLNAFEKSQEFKWNENDKTEIRKKAKERAKNLSKNYEDIDFNEKEIEKLIDDVMGDLLL